MKQIKTTYHTMEVFNHVVFNNMCNIISWLRRKYQSLSEDDAEDIVQESSIDLWSWAKDKDCANWKESDYMNLWFTFCRNKCTHWLKKSSKTTELSDTMLRILEDSTDSNIQMTKREMLYNYMERMNDKDRTLIRMTLEGKDNETICKALGLKNKAVLKNIKCRVLKRMKRDLASSDNIEWAA